MYDCTDLFMSSLADWHLGHPNDIGTLQFEVLQMILLWNSCMDFSLDICTHFPECVTRDGKAGHRTGTCLALVATTTEFSKRIVPIYTPLVIYEVPSHLSVFLIT